MHVSTFAHCIQTGQTYTTRVTTDGEVAGCVNAQEAFLEEPLHSPLEAGNGIALLNQAHDIAALGPAKGGIGRDVTTQTTGVVVQAGAVLGHEAGDLQGGIDRSQVDGHAVGSVVSMWVEIAVSRGVILGKGTVADTATTHARRNGCVGSGRGTVVSDVVTVARHTVFGAIEDGRVDGVGGVLVPRPVRLVAIVATLGAEGVLIGPGKVAMPRKEVTLRCHVRAEYRKGVIANTNRAVNIQRLVDVDGHKVIVAVPGARSPVGVRPGGFGHQAEHGIGIFLAIGGCKGAPVEEDE